MSCIQVTTLQFYWSHRICRIVVELVLWQVINDLPVWQFANAHKGMRKNAGSENLSFCQNSTAIFRGRSPSFSELRQREVRHFLRGVQYWPYAHKVMWKVPHLSSGKRQSLSPVSTTSSLLPSFTTHWTKIGFWRLISLTWNFTGKNAISDGSSSIQSSPKNPILFERSLTNFPKNSNIPLAAEIHNGEWLYWRLWQKISIWFSVQHWWAAHSTLLFFLPIPM